MNVRIRASRWAGVTAIAGAVLLASQCAAVRAVELVEPTVFASVNGVLDLLIVATTEQIKFSPVRVNGWVYEICPRPQSGANVCPPSAVDWYGGSRLQLQQGDTLKIRLVNKLPPVPDAKHANDPGYAFLTLNPTNLHTHGMLVSAHYPTLAKPNYGDNVFVLTFNSANGPPPAGSHLHGDVRNDFTDYEIKIPKHHPSGLFWFHPHAHGISLNQISSGMAGIITVGSPRDYICHDRGCGRWFADVPVRHLILKDTQILATGSLLDQQDPAFCPQVANKGTPPRRGSCIGSTNVEDDSRIHSNTPIPGRWYFTVNGQQYPDITVPAPSGEIWRITNASASIAYNLRLRDRTNHRNALMQVVAIDGVSVQPKPDTTLGQLASLGGTKFQPASCPPAPAAAAGAPAAGEPICARSLLMFPSSRVEVWVTYRDDQDMPVTPPPGAAATFLTRGVTTGPGGDFWPRVALANVAFTADSSKKAVPPVLSINGQALDLMHPSQLATELIEPNKMFAPEADCKPLAKGHQRRIFFNSLPPPAGVHPPVDVESPFGLGYEEIDADGNPVPGTFLDVTVFDPNKPTICLTLGPGNTPVNEKWQLVNLASEDHNFHMHQTKFELVSRDRVEGTAVPREGVLHDNVPVRHADGTCNSVADWRKGLCTAHPVTVEIPFSVAGDYVYHCHILEHEDGGMMARIRVRSHR